MSADVPVRSADTGWKYIWNVLPTKDRLLRWGVTAKDTFLNRPISLSVGRMRKVAITLVQRRQAPVPETTCTVSGPTRTELQQGCRTYKNTEVPSMHCGSGGLTKLAGESGLFSASTERNDHVFVTCVVARTFLGLVSRAFSGRFRIRGSERHRFTRFRLARTSPRNRAMVQQWRFRPLYPMLRALRERLADHLKNELWELGIRVPEAVALAFFCSKLKLCFTVLHHSIPRIRTPNITVFK